jgi:F-box-like
MLPPDIWEKICYYLKYEDICSISLACKTLKNVTNRPTIYKRMLRRIFKRGNRSFSKFDTLKKESTYKEAYKDLHFRGSYATNCVGGILLSKNIVAAVECTNMSGHNKSYILFTKHKLCEASILKFSVNYITNFREGAVAKFDTSLYLSRTLCETKKSPAISIGILDQQNFTNYIHKIRSIFNKIEDILILTTSFPVFFLDKKMISLNNIACKEKLMFEDVETIKGEVLDNLRIIIEDGKISKIYHHVYKYVHKINSIPIKEYFKLHDL